MNPIRRFTSDKELFISSDSWSQLNKTYSKNTIIKFFIELILKNEINLPYKDYSDEVLDEDFFRLKSIKYKDLEVTDPCYTKYDYEYPLSQRYLRILKGGSKTSNFFHQKTRYACDSIYGPGPLRTWTVPKFLETFLPALWSLKYTKVSSAILCSLFNVRKYVPSQFRPSVAKYFYDRFKAKNVLDFSMGWGDRLSGFLASSSTSHYFGIDPNVCLRPGLTEQYKRFNLNKDCTFLFEAAEDALIPKNYFDMVFSSPPYYNVEKYTYSENQSWVRYKLFDDWMSKFLLPVIYKSVEALKPGGHLVINISDVYSGHKHNKICDPMNDFISDLNLKYVEGIGMKINKRPNRKYKYSGSLVEPIWVWQKL